MSEYHRKLQDYYTAQKGYAALQHAAQNYTFNVATQTTTQYPVFSTNSTVGYGYPAHKLAPWMENNAAALRQAMQTLSPEDCVTYMQMEADAHKWNRIVQLLSMSDELFPGLSEMRKVLPAYNPCDCHATWWPTEEEIRALIAKFRLLYGG